MESVFDDGVKWQRFDISDRRATDDTSNPLRDVEVVGQRYPMTSGDCKDLVFAITVKGSPLNYPWFCASPVEGTSMVAMPNN